MQRKSMRAQSAARRITFTLAALMSQASSLTPKPRVVVVGGGVGGLATAGRLQRLGAECTVLEKNEKLGGRVGEHRWEGHRWETGASLLLLPDVYRRALEAARRSVAVHVGTGNLLDMQQAGLVRGMPGVEVAEHDTFHHNVPMHLEREGLFKRELLTLLQPRAARQWSVLDSK